MEKFIEKFRGYVKNKYNYFSFFLPLNSQIWLKKIAAYFYMIKYCFLHKKKAMM